MNTRLLVRFSLIMMLATVALPVDACCKKQVAKAVVVKLLARDAARDAASATKAKAVAHSTTVWRYTTVAQARRELQTGIRPGSHFTPGVTPGRLPRPATAQRQYGLPQTPQVRMTVRIDKGRLVLRNKALGGEPGRGELVSPGRIPPDAIQRVARLPRPAAKH